ncbi:MULTISPECIES: ABC transporter ATP-binding protein [Streptomyces]|uniref:Putative ABC transport system ATP-binding protein n=1 Tax=Streptomyces pini TaxID=1520580 RepID=A0A1I4FN32_9ACTN|nr:MULTISPECIES: ABC transporter ATP-binding protein [Streptomyces]SFL18347.1 putative ABC transport system ATP-binding protein [Streptomyces pini]
MKERTENMDPLLNMREITVELPRRVLLRGVNLSVRAGEAVAIVGPSGSGKTTLLNCAAGLVRPQSGTVVVAGRNIGETSDDETAGHRLSHIGMVFQFGELMPELSVVDNVALPALFAGYADARERAAELLSLVGLDGYGDRAPEELSGGETQRAAIARALVCEPALVLADEPTGSLDEENVRLVTGVLLDACRRRGAALVVATHDASVAASMDRSTRLRGGVLESLDLLPDALPADGGRRP